MKKYSITKALNGLKSDTNNAVAFIYEDAKFSDGILNNKTITIKDIFATKDAPTQASSKILENFNPGYDATIIKKLKNSGGAILAKVHSDELALGGTGQLSGFGPIANPLDKSRISGGSSSGSVASMNEDIAIAIASDTGDSVRYPASLCGLVGFKPSYGAVSRYGMFAFASSLDTVGWFTHDVTTSIDVAKVLYKQDEKDLTSLNVKIENVISTKPKKIAVLKVENQVEDYVNQEFEMLKAQLIKENIEVSEVDIEKELLDVIGITYDIISFSEASSNLSNLTGIGFGNRVNQEDWTHTMISTRDQKLGPMVQRRLSLGSFYLEKDNQEKYFVKAQKVRRLISDAFSKILDQFDLLIYPSTPEIAPLISKSKKDTFMSSILIYANMVGNPSLTLKFKQHNNLPFGLQLDTKIYGDEKLFSYALWFEKFLGGNDE